MLWSKYAAGLLTLAGSAMTAQQVFTADYAPKTSSQPSLFDVLTIERQLGIFFDYARDDPDCVAALRDDDSTIVFAPPNQRIRDLVFKPHMTQQGLSDWLRNHFAHSGPDGFRTLSGKDVVVKDNVLHPYGFPILDTKDASNGRLYIVDGVLN